MTALLLSAYIALCIFLLCTTATVSSETQQAHDSFVNSELDNYILFFDEWRFDWDDSNDFGANGCTNNLQTIHKQLCVSQTKDGDFTFQFRKSKENIDNNNNYNTHSNMVSAAKQLSDYYNNIELTFDDDNFWSSIQSIDGIHGYEAIKKCQPFIFMELCAIYNPYADNLNVHIKLANFKKRRISSKYPFKKSKISNANHDYYNIDEEDDDEEEQLSISDAISLAMRDYDDTLGYAYWRGNELGFDKFDERNPTKATLPHNDDELNKAFSGQTYYFNTLSFDWDDSRDWISFSKQTEPAANTEEVGAHPDKLEEVGAHPKQAELSSGGAAAKDSGAKTAAADSAPSRSFTKCTGAIPFIHKHACVTVGSRGAHLQLTSATEQEINILYNGLNDILNEIDSDQQDASQQQQQQESIDEAFSEINDVYDDDDGERRRLQAIHERDDITNDEYNGLQFNFNKDYHWDEIINSYGFEQDNENNYGRFGHKRAKNDHTHDADDGISAAVGNMINNLNVRTLRPKLMHKTVPFLFPSIIKCVHTKIVRLCLAMDVHKKAVKLHVMMPRFAPMFKCVRSAMQCNPYRLQTGKRVFNGIKKGMRLIRSIGTRNPYKQPKKHLRKALRQIRRIRKVLKHLTRQIKKTLWQFSASQTDDNLYDDNEDDESMAQKVYDATDERGLLFYAQKGTNDFNDIWDDDNQWNAIQDMTAWDGRGIRRKCLKIWKKRLCLCQFLGWLDGPEKYHCLFPHNEEYNGYNAQHDHDLYENVQIKNMDPQIIVHHFHHISAAKEIENNIKTESDAIYPAIKPKWIPLWMWQQIKSRAQNEQISKLLYSAHEEQYSDDDDVYNNQDDNEYEEEYDNKDYYDQYRAALDEYYENSRIYDDTDVEDRMNLNEIYAEDNEEQEDEQYMKHDAWIEMSESATHDFDTEWNNDQHWDEISDIKTWEGTAIKRKCLHLWKHRLCLCQFLGWMDTNKYKCIYHHRTWAQLTQQRDNTVRGHESDTRKSPNVIFNDHVTNEGGPVIHHFVPMHHYETPTTHEAPLTIHHIYHYAPYHHDGARRARKRKVINFIPERPIHWDHHRPTTVHRQPILVHHFHHVLNTEDQNDHHTMHEFHQVSNHMQGAPFTAADDHNAIHEQQHPRHTSVGGLLRSRSRSRSESSSEDESQASGASGASGLQRRWNKLREREEKERAREKKFKDLLWSDRHSHRMWKLMKQPHKPVFGHTVTGQHIIARQINPHGEPLMVSMHKHMPSHRPQWMPQGLFTNLKHKMYYMVHAHQKGDHSTVTGDENRFVHGSDIVSAQTEQYDHYDVYDNYYYYDADDASYYSTEYDDTLFDVDAVYEKYNDEKYENEAFDQNKYMDEFVDDWNDEWVIADIVNALESAFYNLFDIDDDEDKYWDDLDEFETKKGEIMQKKCLHIFDKMKCLCSYHGSTHHYHCHKKNIHRNRFYLNSLMPKETPEWMSAHDFDWLKDQRLSAFTEILPDPLMQHIESNDLFSIPFNALSLLVHPAVKMEHIKWHKDQVEDISSANRIYDNMYDSMNWYSDDIYANNENIFSTAYINEYGDYIIDEFYNELDGTKWVVTNQWTNDLNDVWQNEDEMQVFSASTGGASTEDEDNDKQKKRKRKNKQTDKVETDAARTLSSKCMLVFGRNVCLCEFINWVYDHSGDNPLYRCYSSEISSITSVQSQNGNMNTNMENSNNVGNNNDNQQKHRAQVLNKLKNLEKTVMETGKKIDELVSKQGASAGATSQSMKSKTGGGGEGWGSKIDNYGYNSEYDDDEIGSAYAYAYAYVDDDDDDIYDEDDSVYDGYDAFYDDSEVNDDEQDMNQEEEESEEDQDRESAQPNWWTEGDGFSQRVYIGTNTFWGLILLSLFFGMIACSVICGYFHLQKMFCKNKRMSMVCNPPIKMSIYAERERDQLYPIDEDKM